MKKLFQPNATISDLLAGQPSAARVLIRLNIGCVGCPFARFCTLEDAARKHQVPLATLMWQLENLDRTQDRRSQ